MKTIHKIYFPLIVLTSCILACTQPVKEENKEQTTISTKSENVQLINEFICGLWSLDSNRSLTNVGFYIKPDGTIDFLGGDLSGDWKLEGKNLLVISYSQNEKENVIKYNLDSLSESQMILSDSMGQSIYRKVPFGMNIDEIVLTGFHGTLFPGISKEYSFVLSSAKKIRLSLKSDDSNIKMRVFDSGKEISSIPLSDWQSIMVKSGTYKVKVDYLNPKLAKMNDFDLKVFGQ